jgi:hypothetical protein
MGEQPPDPSPDEFLLRDNLTLRELFAGYGAAARAGGRGSDYVRAILNALTLHFLIEEQVCFPSLQSLRSPVTQSRVGLARNAHAAIRKLLEALAAHGREEERALMTTLEPMAAAYMDFEESQLLPCLSALPEVTLREMSLEMQELAAKQGRFNPPT